MAAFRRGMGRVGLMRLGAQGCKYHIINRIGERERYSNQALYPCFTKCRCRRHATPLWSAKLSVRKFLYMKSMAAGRGYRAGGF